MSDDEISRGLVLHLDPDSLEAAGATYTGAEDKRVRGGHFFVCIEVDDVGGHRWAPMFTADGPRRVSIDTAGSTGSAKFTGGTFHFHPGQIWTATSEQVRIAAVAGEDSSRTGDRKRFAEAHTPWV